MNARNEYTLHRQTQFKGSGIKGEWVENILKGFFSGVH